LLALADGRVDTAKMHWLDTSNVSSRAKWNMGLWTTALPLVLYAVGLRYALSIYHAPVYNVSVPLVMLAGYKSECVSCIHVNALTPLG